jgi:hypothetical protein
MCRSYATVSASSVSGEFAASDGFILSHPEAIPPAPSSTDTLSPPPHPADTAPAIPGIAEPAFPELLGVSILAVVLSRKIINALVANLEILVTSEYF